MGVKMNIQLLNKIGKLTINLHKFRNVFVDTFNLELSFNESYDIISLDGEEIDRATLSKYVFHGTNWGNFFKFFTETEKKKISFTVYKCECKGLTQYKPKELDQEMNFSFDKDELKHTGFIVINDLIEKMESHIEDYISNNSFNYIENTWKSKK